MIIWDLDHKIAVFINVRQCPRWLVFRIIDIKDLDTLNAVSLACYHALIYMLSSSLRLHGYEVNVPDFVIEIPINIVMFDFGPYAVFSNGIYDQFCIILYQKVLIISIENQPSSLFKLFIMMSMAKVNFNLIFLTFYIFKAFHDIRRVVDQNSILTFINQSKPFTTVRERNQRLLTFWKVYFLYVFHAFSSLCLLKFQNQFLVFSMWIELTKTSDGFVAISF